MGNNAEIRSRMETYRKALLALVWIGAVIGVIVGFVIMGASYTASAFGIPVIIFAVVGGIIGHFLVNVTLAIPFILLNNGDTLAAYVGGNGTNSNLGNEKDEPQKEDTPIPLSNNQIKIIRLKNVVGSALLADIKVDNKNFKFEDGEEKTIDIENGKHTISVFFNNEHANLEFEINNSNKVFSVSTKPPIKILES